MVDSDRKSTTFCAGDKTNVTFSAIFLHFVKCWLQLLESAHSSIQSVCFPVSSNVYLSVVEDFHSIAFVLLTNSFHLGWHYHVFLVPRGTFTGLFCICNAYFIVGYDCWCIAHRPSYYLMYRERSKICYHRHRP